MEHSAVVALSPVTRALVRALLLAGSVVVLWLIAGTTAAHADGVGGLQDVADAGNQVTGTVDRVDHAVGQPVRRTTGAVAGTVRKSTEAAEEPVRRTASTVRDTVKRTADVVEAPVRRTTQVVKDTVDRATGVVNGATDQVRDQVDDTTGPVDDVVDPGDGAEAQPAASEPAAAATTPERADRELRADVLASRSVTAVPNVASAATEAHVAGAVDVPVQAPTPAPTAPRDHLPEGNGGSAGGSTGAPVAAFGSPSLSSPGSVLMPTPVGVRAFQPAPGVAPGSTPD